MRMTSSTTLLVALVAILSITLSNGFAGLQTTSLSAQSFCSKVHSNSLTRMPVLYMSEKEEEKASKVSADGTYYDDEVEPEPKIGISDSMRSRLLQEAGTGLNADKPQPNVLLYIMGLVAVLVILGGKDILY